MQQEVAQLQCWVIAPPCFLEQFTLKVALKTTQGGRGFNAQQANSTNSHCHTEWG